MLPFLKHYLFCMLALATFAARGQEIQPQTAWKGKVKTVKISDVKYYRYDEKYKREPLTLAEYQLVEKNEDRADKKRINKFVQLQTSLEYDQDGYPVKIILHEDAPTPGNVCVNEYDQQHHPIKQTWYESQKKMDVIETTTWVYNSSGQIIRKEVTRSSNKKHIVIDRSYNDAGQLLAETITRDNEEPEKTANIYEKGKLVKTVHTGAYKKMFNTYTYDRSAPLKILKTSFDRESGEAEWKNIHLEDTLHHVKASYEYMAYNGQLCMFDSTCFNEKNQLVKNSKLRWGNYTNETYEYDGQGFMTLHKSLYFEKGGDTIPDVSTDTFFTGSNTVRTHVYTTSHKKTSETYDRSGNTVLRITDQDGLLMRMEYYDGASIVYRFVTDEKRWNDRYDYIKKYDRQGNLVKMTEVKNGLVSTGNEIEITYY